MNWFDKQHPIQLTLKTFTVLVGKAPTKSKRIRMGFILDLTSGDVQGIPDWLMDARDFVMEHGDTVTNSLSAPGFNITFGDANLFKKKPVEAPKSDLRKFTVFSAGNADEPETLLSFIVYTPFSTDLNRWCGQMAGETFTATFEGAVPDVGDIVLKSKDADEDEEEDNSAADEDDEEEDELDAQQRRKEERAARDNAAAQPTAAAVAKARKNLAVM